MTTAFSIGEKSFTINILSNSHKRQNFDCGIKSLKSYLQKHAGQDQRKHIAVSYLLIDTKQKQIAGYYTLSSMTIALKDIEAIQATNLPHYPALPATLIGRLAVDKTYHRKGLGELLLIDALKRCEKSSQTIASYAVVVDAINENAATFYQKYQFKPFSSLKQKLYLPMRLIKQLS